MLDMLQVDRIVSVQFVDDFVGPAANTDRNTKVTTTLTPPISGRYVRLEVDAVAKGTPPTFVCGGTPLIHVDGETQVENAVGDGPVPTFFRDGTGGASATDWGIVTNAAAPVGGSN